MRDLRVGRLALILIAYTVLTYLAIHWLFA